MRLALTHLDVVSVLGDATVWGGDGFSGLYCCSNENRRIISQEVKLNYCHYKATFQLPNLVAGSELEDRRV